MQQVYSKLQDQLGDEAIAIATKIRSHLEMNELLEAPKLLPQHDPVRFQRLDHCFTRKQWLNTVCSCKSKLYTGFPSDHYLLVTDFKVKLLARKPQPPKRPRLDFRNVTQASKNSFNQQFQQLVGLPQTTTPILPS